MRGASAAGPALALEFSTLDSGSETDAMDRDAMNIVAGRNAGLEAAPRNRAEVERRAAIFVGSTECGGYV